MKVDLLSLLTVPLFMAVVGYVTNWTGVWMLFKPIRFAGFQVPGLKRLVHVLPRRLQQMPGLNTGGLGWQGIIPSRAAKMGSIAVDKGIAKVGDASEFYDCLRPDEIARHIVSESRGDMRGVVERVMEREQPELWERMGPELRETVHRRVQEQLPEIVDDVTQRIGEHIDDLLDVKLMVVEHLERNPQLANRVFEEVGERELRFIIRFGFLFGLVLGVPVAILTELLLPEQTWLLPLCGVVVGYVTNWVAIKMIFEPVEPRRVLGVTLHGLFLRRQPEAAKVYARVIAEDVITMRNLGEALMRGPSVDRTRMLIEDSLRPALDRAVGPLQPAVRVAVGPRSYDATRDSLAREGVARTLEPLTDEDLDRRQRGPVYELIARRTRELAHPDFAEMLRSAMREDEWLLYLHGAVLGLAGGVAHLLVFG